MLRAPNDDTVAPSHSVLGGSGDPAPFLPPPFTKSQCKRGGHSMSVRGRRKITIEAKEFGVSQGTIQKRLIEYI